MSGSDEIGSAAIRDDLQQLNRRVNDFLKINPANHWHQLNEKVPVWAAVLDMQSLVESAPCQNPYYRQPFFAEEATVCLTVFVFKRSDHPGAVVLLHTYGSSSPNGDIYTDHVVTNAPKKNGIIEQATPIHNHTVHCHSYVAWTSGNVKVRERLYARGTTGLILLEEQERPAGNCALDASCGEYLHSVAVQFL
jgi:hypothetical protein